MKKGAFLDRDGVINRKAPEGQYVTRWEDMEFLPGACDAIRLLNHSGFLVVVVSNQRCIAKGLLSTDELESMHARMRREFEAAGAKIDAIYYCPHDTQPPCGCRKPEPGMLLNAARTHDIDLAASWVIGDSEHDVEAGKKVGCRTTRVIANNKTTNTGAELVASSLLDAIQKILQVQAVPSEQHCPISPDP
jgi:D-glycero-D-manno-heptose 1,7-bisphosphate phosphatase